MEKIELGSRAERDGYLTPSGEPQEAGGPHGLEES
jgi:hypothetical protein